VQNPIIEALAASARSRGSAPLLTWYSPTTGARTELSVRSFANWVDKTANLLTEWDVRGATVRGTVNADHPGHWMSLIWPLAAWQAGCSYTVRGEDDAAVVVLGPDLGPAVAGHITVACSLHPLGLGLRGLTGDVLDFTSEALAQPDAHDVAAITPGAMAWIDETRSLSHAELAVEPVADRVLVRPSSAWLTLAAAILAPLQGGGSAVVVDGEIGPDALAQLVASERITKAVA